MKINLNQKSILFDFDLSYFIQSTNYSPSTYFISKSQSTYYLFLSI